MLRSLVLVMVLGAFGVFLDAPQAVTLLVANKTDATVDLLDPETGKSRATLPTGKGPHEVAVSPEGKLAVVSNYGAQQPGASLTVIDVVSGAVLRTIELGRHKRPHGMAFLSDRELAVTTEDSAHLLIVDAAAGTIAREIETGQRVSHMVALVLGAKRAFVANIVSGSVTVVDLAEGKKLRDVATGAGAEGIAATPDGKHVWVGNREADTLTVIDASTLAVVATLPCPGFPIRVAVTPDGKRVLVSCARSGEIAVFDAVERKELLRRKLDLAAVQDKARRLFGDAFGGSPVPIGLVVAPDGRTAWVAATQADVVAVIDPATLEVRDLLRAGREPDGMGFSPLGGAR